MVQFLHNHLRPVPTKTAVFQEGHASPITSPKTRLFRPGSTVVPVVSFVTYRIIYTHTHTTGISTTFTTCIVKNVGFSIEFYFPESPLNVVAQYIAIHIATTTVAVEYVGLISLFILVTGFLLRLIDVCCETRLEQSPRARKICTSIVCANDYYYNNIRGYGRFDFKYL